MLAMQFQGLRKGTRLHAEAGGKYWAAEVIALSKRKRYPVKITFLGYDRRYDEWMGLERLRSKAVVSKETGLRWQKKVPQEEPQETILSSASVSINKKVLSAMVEVSFDDIDLNKDGVITLEEFAFFVAKLRESVTVADEIQEVTDSKVAFDRTVEEAGAAEQLKELKEELRRVQDQAQDVLIEKAALQKEVKALQELPKKVSKEIHRDCFELVLNKLGLLPVNKVSKNDTRAVCRTFEAGAAEQIEELKKELKGLQDQVQDVLIEKAAGAEQIEKLQKELKELQDQMQDVLIEKAALQKEVNALQASKESLPDSPELVLNKLGLLPVNEVSKNDARAVCRTFEAAAAERIEELEKELNVLQVLIEKAAWQKEVKARQVTAAEQLEELEKELKGLQDERRDVLIEKAALQEQAKALQESKKEIHRDCPELILNKLTRGMFGTFGSLEVCKEEEEEQVRKEEQAQEAATKQQLKHLQEFVQAVLFEKALEKAQLREAAAAKIQRLEDRLRVYEVVNLGDLLGASPELALHVLRFLPVVEVAQNDTRAVCRNFQNLEAVYRCHPSLVPEA